MPEPEPEPQMAICSTIPGLITKQALNATAPRTTTRLSMVRTYGGRMHLPLGFADIIVAMRCES